MNNSNTTAINLSNKILRFSAKMSKGLKRSEFKLISDMQYGILGAQNCKLSDIGRALNEKITLKKTIERLASGLDKFESADVLHENHLKYAEKHINPETPFIIDGGDVNKQYGEKFEDLGRVFDGSEGKIVKGYASVGVAALTEQKLPIMLYDHIYSHKERDFSSENTETIKALKFLKSRFGTENIRTFDRGYDRNVIFEELIKSEVNFIVRMTSKRNVISKGKSVNIAELSGRFKGKISMEFKGKDGKTIYLKITNTPVELPDFRGVKLSLVVCYGFGDEPMMLLTNVANKQKIAKTVTKTYLLRWRIEELYRLKKSQFGFEGFRVRSLNAIRNLSLILDVLLGFLAVMGEQVKSNQLVRTLTKLARRIYAEIPGFWLYTIANGARFCLAKWGTGIRSKTKKRTPADSQFSFFPLNPWGIDWAA